METSAQSTEYVKKRNRASVFNEFNAKARIFIDSWVRAVCQPCLLAACTFFFSFSQCFTVPSPFAVAWIAALGVSGYSLIWPAVGAGAALGMRMLWGISLDAWQYAGILGMILVSPWWKKRGDLGLAIISAAALLPRLFISFFSDVPGSILLSGAAVLMGAVAAPAFKQAVGVLSSSRHTLSMDDKLCCLMLAILLLTGTGFMELFTINIGQALATALICALAYSAGSAAAVCGGLLMGAALALSGHDSLIMVQLSLGGLLSGLVMGRGKRWEVWILFLLAHLLASLFTGSSYSPLSHSAALVGCLLFWKLDERPLLHLKALLLAAQPVHAGMENAFASEQMRRWESLMEKMAESLPTVAGQSETPAAEQLAAVFCRNCAQLQTCWDEKFSHTKAMLQAVMEQADKGEEALEKAVTALRGCGCIRLHGLQEAAKNIQKEKRSQKAQELRAQYERDMIRTHLIAMARSVGKMAQMVTGETIGDLQAAYEVSKVIREIGFPGKLAYARQVAGHLQVGIEGEPLSFARWQPEKLIEALWEKVHLNMREAALEKGRLLLEEVPAFSVCTGSATLCAKQPEGGEVPVSGDAVLQDVYPGGACLIALSDGMGHGENARCESQKTLELLSFCLATGYTREQAITAVNGMMLSASGGEKFATVDLCVLDLWTGEAEIEKLGACTSYLVRGGHVKSIVGVALPLGILEHVTPICQRLRLYDGDFLIFISDGVQDAYPDSMSLEKAISHNFYEDPQRMADALLRSALITAGGIPKDDMTVLTVKVAGGQSAA